MIPIKIETLLEGRKVEQNRIEYKEGFNSSDIVHTICGYANDIAGVDGGYLVIGVKTENGIPVLPPVGVPNELLDDIQLKIFQYCNKIEPRYIPKIEIVEYQGGNLVYLKCAAGDAGPYQAPVDVYSKKEAGKEQDRTMKYWIRPASLTVEAKQKVRARRYRNPKIGEFFKEIDLSEKKSTGISKILRELKRNGSPMPEFETDADRTYMITTIRIHEGFETENENFNQKNERSLSEVLRQKDYDKVRTIVNFMEEHGEITPKEAETITGKSAATVRRYFKILVDTRYIVAEGSTNNIVYRISMNLSENV